MNKQINNSFAVLYIIFLFTIISCKNYNPTEKLKSGRILYEKGEYENAIVVFNEVLKDDSINIDAFFYRADAYFMLQKHNKAITDLSTTIRLNPKYRMAFLRRGFVYFTIRKFNLAIADYTSEINNYPNEIESYYNRACVYTEALKYDLALKDFDKVINLKPNDGGAFYERGVVYLKIKKNDLAINDFLSTIRWEPNNAFAYNNIGLIYDEQRDYKKAIFNYTKAIDFNTENAKYFLLNRARTYEKMGENELAIADYKKVADFGLEDGSKKLKQKYNINYPVQMDIFLFKITKGGASGRICNPTLLPVVCFTKQNKCVIAGRSLFDFVRWEASLLTCILKI
jgi:tetratricopeptide (TPR) repeat protein